MSEGNVKWGGGGGGDLRQFSISKFFNEGGERGGGVLIGKNFMFIHTINTYKRKIQTNICYVTVFYFLKFQDGRVAIP